MRVLCLFAVLGLTQLLQGQNKLYLGSSMGYAHGETGMSFLVFKNPMYSMNPKHNLMVGADLYYSLGKSLAGISSGLKYNRKWDENTNAYSYLTFPLVLDVTIGKKFFFQTGIGGYANILLKHDEAGMEKNTNNFLFGRIVNVGLGVAINDDLLMLKFENFSDVSKAGQYREYSLSGGYDVYSYEFQVNYFRVVFLHNIR